MYRSCFADQRCLNAIFNKVLLIDVYRYVQTNKYESFIFLYLLANPARAPSTLISNGFASSSSFAIIWPAFWKWSELP